MKQFIKDNITLVLGISLPVLLTMFFILAGTLPKYFVSDPTYDVIFADSEYSEYSFVVKNQRIYLKVTPQSYGESNYEPHLYRYRASTGNTEEISFIIPDEAKKLAMQEFPLRNNNTNINIPVDPTRLPTAEQAQDTAKIVSEINQNTNKNIQPMEFAIDELKEIKLNSSTIAPDGYEFNDSTRSYRGGLIGEINGSYRANHNSPALSKNGRNVVIPYNPSKEYYYNTPKLIGWVIP